MTQQTKSHIRGFLQFWHEVFRDQKAIENAAHQGSYDDFIKVYKRIDRNMMYGRDRTLLGAALTNSNIEARIKIASKLLDDCADVNLGQPLVTYMDAHSYDFVKEQPLLRRIIKLGADINNPVGRWGTPLIALAQQFSFNESDLLPFYDVYFEQPNLDLSVMSGSSRHESSQYKQIQKMAKLRPVLLERADAYLGSHKLPKPKDALMTKDMT